MSADLRVAARTPIRPGAWWLTAALASFLALLGCQRAPKPASPAAALAVTSPAFAEGERIPQQYTCDGENLSPPLAWSGVPAEAKSLVLIADDPDAPIGTWVHWVTYDLPPELTGLEEATAELGTAGTSSFNQPGYGGPCPPSGMHRYFFKVYALDTRLELAAGAHKAAVEKAMQGHVLAQGQLMGTYQRARP
jgi:Raf kinase inhibitor-like YbhB/YbcL family protein